MSGCCDTQQRLPSCSHGLVDYCYKCDTKQWDHIHKINSEISQLWHKINDLYQIREKMDFKKPHKCPVCEGCGKIIINNGQVLTSYPPQYPTKICNICEGKGIVWG